MGVTMVAKSSVERGVRGGESHHEWNIMHVS